MTPETPEGAGPSDQDIIDGYLSSDDEDDGADDAPEQDIEDDGAEVGDDPDDADAEDGGEPEIPDEIWTIDAETGEFVLLPRDEAKAGYLKDKGFTQKTQALSAERKAFEREQQQIRQQMMDSLAQWAVDEEQEPDWGALARQGYNAQTIFEAQSKFRQRAQKRDEARQAYQQLRAEQVAEAEARILEMEPEWSVNEAKYRQEFMGLLNDVQAEYGLDVQAVAQTLADRPEVYQVLRDAARWRKSQAQNARTTKKVSRASPVMKPGARTRRSDAAAQKNREAMRRLAKSGSLEDAMKIDF